MHSKFEDLQKRYNEALQQGVDKLDSTYLLKMHSNYFKCGLNCTSKGFTSSSDLESCIKRCEKPLSNVQYSMQQELNKIQQRLQQCASECAMKIGDRMPENATQSQKDSGENEMMSCASKCVDDQLTNVLPQLFSRLSKSMQETVQDQERLLH
ncbi:hypothetical protein Ciccas_000139 [Cichlidogyrus casuarinus]|uniref:Protein FAM136A n=1 Tax=Cichlidogyrus casuarinus TaxID=1844966 RepID=A0ABD2QNS6_9PLAT